MHAVFARSPLQQLPMATNRPTTRRKSAKHLFDDDDAPPAKRPKTEVNGTGRRTNGATNKAAKTAYDEDDDGFQFTRRTSRRTTAKVQLQPEPEPEPVTKQPLNPVQSRRKKDPAVAPEPHAESQKRRRSTRLSADKEQFEARPEAPQPPKRVKKSAPIEKKKQVTPAPDPETTKKSAVPVVGVQTPRQNELHVAKKRDGGATKIMLPFADTPVITRNKEMRKGSKDGHRRSSTGMRGRRASSLIDSGLSNALPHPDVEVRDYHRYIEQSQPEPRRMKQLLTWCGSKAVIEKPSGNVKDSNAIMSARAIEQELLEDFANKPELSDWFSREDIVPITTVKKPNPQNISMQSALEELEEEIKRLEEEDAAWETLTSTTTRVPPPPPTIHTTIPSLADIDTSLLDPSQGSILATLQLPQASESSSEEAQPPSSAFSYTTSFALQSHITKLSRSLEPNIDIFADGVHKIEQYRNTAERCASKVLGTASHSLEQRDKAVKEKVGSEGIGVGDVLRSLAGVLNDS